MLKWRLISSAVLISGLVTLLYLDSSFPLGGTGIWLLPLAIIVSQMMVYELLDLWRERQDRPTPWPVYLGAALTIAAAAFPAWTARASDSGARVGTWSDFGPLDGTLLAFAFSLAVILAVELLHFDKPGLNTSRIAHSFMAVSYCGLLLSFLVSLRLVGEPSVGMIALLSLIVIVKLSDSGAYFTGRMLGRHKLAPRLSPGKTVEGALGGLLIACLMSWLVFPVLLPRLFTNSVDLGPWWGWVVYAALLTLAGMLGDLAESLLKRDADRKDSSTWLPGLGGVLDILDSIVFAAPVAYFCWRIGLVGPGS
jgi:phosphatidate cytidylyltransferase